MHYLIGDRLKGIAKGDRCEACAAPLATRPLNTTVVHEDLSTLCPNCQNRGTLFYIGEKVSLTIPEFFGMNLIYNGRQSVINEGNNRVYLVSFVTKDPHLKKSLPESNYMHGVHQHEYFFLIPYSSLLKMSPSNVNSLHLLDKDFS